MLPLNTYDPAIPLSHLYSKELRTGPKPDICILMFIAILFTITKRWKQPKCILTDEWTNKTLYIQTMKYYSTLKRKKVLTCTTAGINLEDMIPSERSQPVKDKYCVVPLTSSSQKGQICTDRKQNGDLTKDWGSRKLTL